MKIVFLDIDGVLNDHSFNGTAQSCRIDRSCVASLNRVLKETGAKLVISSAWRYMMLGNAMSVSGFDYMLRTHGVLANSVVGYTQSDSGQRADDIADWLSRNKQVTHWCVIDDEPEGMIASPDPLRLVKTDGDCGMCWEDAGKAIAILTKAEAE